MSTGFAKTSFTSSFRILSSSSAHERTNGSAVATVSVVRLTSTGRMRKRSAYAFDIVAGDRREVDLQRIDVEVRHAELAGEPFDEPVERQQRMRRGDGLPVLRGDELERMLAAAAARVRQLVRVVRRHETVGHHQLEDVLELKPSILRDLRHRLGAGRGGCGRNGVAIANFTPAPRSMYRCLHAPFTGSPNDGSLDRASRYRRASTGCIRLPIFRNDSR